LSETFFDYRSRVKQDRLNKFIESLVQYLESHGNGVIPLEIQQSEEFGDLFEAVVRRIIQINSIEKTVRFRNVIGDYISEPIKLDNRDTYLELIDRLNEIQIKILKCHAQIKANVRALLKQRDALKEEMYKLNDKLEREAKLLKEGKSSTYYDHTRAIYGIDEQLREVEKEIKKDGDIRNAVYYGLEKGDFLFLIQDLYSKGLLIDQGGGTFDTKPFETMGITIFGLSFLKFINEDIGNIIKPHTDLDIVG